MVGLRMETPAYQSQCLDENTLVALSENSSDDHLGAILFEHLDRCSQCRRVVGELGKLRRAEGGSAAQKDQIDGESANDLSQEPSTDRYHLGDVLGSGATGIVYRATDTKLDRDVALKVLHQESLEALGEARLLREAKVLAKLSHPNVVTVFDADRLGENIFVAMELVPGQTARQWLRSKPRSRSEVLDVFVDAGRGLAAAHAAGVVHRDFKPDNVLIGPGQRVRVSDFGLARSRPADVDARALANESANGTSGTIETQEGRPEARPETQLTRTGTISGTPAYMSAEQFLAAEVDERSDQFSFCVALYEALCEVRPFSGDDFAAIRDAVVSGSADIRAANRLPRWLRAVIRRGISREPSERFESMDALLAAIKRGRRKRRRMAVTAGLTVGAILIGLASLALGSERSSLSLASCLASAERIDAVWSQGSGSAALASSPAIAERLDDYAGAWRTSHRDACESRYLRGDQSARLFDARMLCLSDRLDELRSAVSAITADSASESTKLRIAWDLESIEACRADRVAASPPPRRAIADRVAKLRTELSDLRARYRQDEPAHRVKADSAALLDRVRAAGYEPLLIDALTFHAQAVLSDARLVEAEKYAREASRVAEKIGDDQRRALTSLLLVKILGLGLRRLDEASALADQLSGLIERLRDDELTTPFELAKAKLAEVQGDLVAAETLYRRVLANPKRNPAQKKFALDAAAGLGDLLVTSGGQLAAVEAFDQAKKLAVDLYGPEHAEVLEVALAEAQARASAGSDEALEILETLRPKFEQIDPRSELAAVFHGMSALILDAHGQVDAAIRSSRRAHEIRRAQLGPDHPFVIEHLIQLASVESIADKKRGLARFNEALNRAENALGKDHPLVASVLMHKIEMFGERGEPSLELARRALGIMEAAVGPDHRSIGRVLAIIANELHMLGRFAEAKATYERAIALNERWNQLDERAAQAIELAGVYTTIGRPKKALAIVDGIDERYRNAAAKTVRANALLSLERRSDGVLEYREALASLKAEGGDSLDLAYAKFDLAVAEYLDGDDEALGRALRLRARIAKELGRFYEDLAAVDFALCGALSDRGRHRAALTHCKRTVKLYRTAAKEVRDETVWAATAAVALELVALNRHLEAIESLEESLTARKSLEGDPVELAEIRGGLAKSLWVRDKPGDRKRALTLAGQALRDYAATETIESRDRATLRVWLEERLR